MFDKSPASNQEPNELPSSLHELHTFDSPISGLSFTACRLATEFGVTWNLGAHALCDCADLTEPYRRFRLHFMPEVPEGVAGQVPEYIYAKSRLCQIPTTAEWYLNEFSKRVCAFDSKMFNDRTDSRIVSNIVSIIESGMIPQADIAVIPTSDPVLTRLLLHLGGTLSDSCSYDIEFDWKRFVQLTQEKNLYDTLIILEKNEGVIEFVEEHNPHLIRIERDEFAGLVATFFNNAPSPGLSKGVAAASEFIDLINTSNDVDTPSFEDLANLVPKQMTIEDAQEVLTQIPEWNFDYFEGRRMKLYLGSQQKPKTKFVGESFDQCAFPGASRYLVDRMRKTGEVTLCLEYYEDDSKLMHAKRPDRY